MGDHDEKDDLRRTVAALAAIVDGERYLDATGAAILLGNLAPATFRQYAAQAGFPRSVKIGKGRKWKRRELLDWADRLRDKQAA